MKRIKNFFLWFTLWNKRLLLRPFFLAVLLLIPAFAWLVKVSGISDSSMLKIGLYIDGTRPDRLAKQLKNDLISSSDQTVQFYLCTSKEQLMHDIEEQKAISGYILTSDLEKRLKEYATKKTPFLTAVQHKAEASNAILNEILLGRLYRTHAYQILENYIREKDKTVDTNFLKTRFSEYQKDELLFRFEYASGKSNKWLNGKSPSLLLLPLRGIVSIMILLSCMTGVLLWYDDKNHGFLTVLNPWKRLLCNLSSLLAPGVLSGIFGLLCIKAAGLWEGSLLEISSMFCFLFACIGLVAFLRQFLRTKEMFLAAMLLFNTGALLFCPVFMDLSIFSSVIKALRYLFPTHFYLRALYNPADQWHLVFYGCIFLLLRNQCHFVKPIT